ncbi:hypothetical protein MCOR27_008651 [Pyricularia oryzae]|uniref:A49-like RNA polymerase I associated factor n=2 Tax=Pyricularia TaxID=48558 RepID=A0ABQ8N697_PYRGI|nr:hypothetical protein MCOR27_008651 [Pyricularia oryzae]KAI6291897.1 hypothetical protein MCOR33_010272 [Pyricularia grisea]KAI6364154.1 hypothetical protein MCOR31_007546 [Pyricularia oryzae]KAI6366901.1 hypothetical protein MCOR32_007290 [Pyricularia oryzae]KAI6390031.1 hypothetical protein MCOR24_010439 [Pyricularia oryzae]
MSEKKRKRTEDGSSQKTSKKAAIDDVVSSSALPQNIKVSSLVRPKLSPPVIATAPGLSVSPSVQFNPYTKLRKASSKSRNAPVLGDILLHSSSHRSLDYTAREEQSQNGEGFLRHYIGVFDPKTGELEVVEARKVTVRGSVRSQQAPAEAMSAIESKTNMDMRTDLGQAFGTKKAKKALVSKVENAITAINNASSRDSGAGEAALMASIKTAAANMPTRDELQAAVDGAKPVPKGNYDAAEIQDVYDPDQIIGSDVLNAIPVRDWQTANKNDENVQLTSRYVANRLRRVGEHAESLKRLRILRYLYFLMTFIKIAKPGKNGVRKLPPRDKLREALSPAPDVVLDSLRHKFADGTQMRKIHADLIMTTCCVLASIIDSFEVDTFDLREDLQLEQKQLNSYFAEIGARTKPVVNGDKKTTIAKLALPLQFPKVSMGRRK